MYRMKCTFQLFNLARHASACLYNEYIYYLLIISLVLSFVLYTACSRLGRRSQVLRHSASHFRRILEALCVEQRNSTPRLASTPGRRNENIKYFTSSSENKTHNLLRLQSHAYASASQLASIGSYAGIIVGRDSLFSSS